MKNEIMLDLETMGTQSNSAIISIGACTIDGQNTFYRPIFLDSCLDAGLKIDSSTEQWWMKQSEEARKVLTDPGRVDLTQALVEFAKWLRSIETMKNTKIWGNGSDFDNVITSNAYKALNFDVPWNFWNNRCFRTAKALGAKVDVPRLGTHHNALDDALHQAAVMREIYKL